MGPNFQAQAKVAQFSVFGIQLTALLTARSHHRKYLELELYLKRLQEAP